MCGNIQSTISNAALVVVGQLNLKVKRICYITRLEILKWAARPEHPIRMNHFLAKVNSRVLRALTPPQLSL